MGHDGTRVLVVLLYHSSDSGGGVIKLLVLIGVFISPPILLFVR